jgi:predicted transcriptional regulator
MKNIIEKNPGIKFSEIMRKTGLKNGVLSHRLRNLEENGTVKVERTPGYTRYYPLKLTREEMTIIKHLRQKTFCKIIILLSENPNISFKNIIKTSKVSSSNVSKVLSKLVSEGIVSIKLEERTKLYGIEDLITVKGIINKYDDVLHGMISKHKFTISFIFLVLIGVSQRFSMI